MNTRAIFHLLCFSATSLFKHKSFCISFVYNGKKKKKSAELRNLYLGLTPPKSGTRLLGEGGSGREAVPSYRHGRPCLQSGKQRV